MPGCIRKRLTVAPLGLGCLQSLEILQVTFVERGWHDRARSSIVHWNCLQSDEVEQMLDPWIVADAVRMLRPEYRSVLLEIYYLGNSVVGAAAALGIPVGTVKSRTYYTLRALKRTLQERGLAPQDPMTGSMAGVSS